MPTPTYTPLATVTLGSAAASVTFSSIPATYRDLIIVTDTLNSSGSENMKIRFNSDTGSNYSSLRVTTDGLGAYSGSINNTTVAYADHSAYGDASNRHNHIIQFLDYSATDKQKTFLSRATNASRGVDAVAARWANTSAITTIRLFYEVGNITTGSRFDLYGIVS
jgi:hypothetical protein